MRLYIDERYQRLDRRTEPGAIAQDNNAFRAYVQDGDVRRPPPAQYLYDHAITEVPGASLAEDRPQRGPLRGRPPPPDPTLFTRWLLDASSANRVSAPVETTASGETASVQLWWRRPPAPITSTRSTVAARRSHPVGRHGEHRVRRERQRAALPAVGGSRSAARVRRGVRQGSLQPRAPGLANPSLRRPRRPPVRPADTPRCCRALCPVVRSLVRRRASRSIDAWGRRPSRYASSTCGDHRERA
jgi:hypothetical protein